MLEEILSRENMTQAYKRVKSNDGAAGVDGMRVQELKPYLDDAWAFIKADILEGIYVPSAVLKVEIPKSSGGKRMLGIPTVLDRLIQQAISQHLIRLYDEGFSANSYGFRPRRNAHQAVQKAKEYVNTGYTEIIELDLEKFFDTVNHDYLMSLLSRKITDKRLLRLVRKYLRAGIMTGSITIAMESGTPQGSPLSPVLSNILLDELDKELERRGHKFVRYADDCSIYVKSKKAAIRVLSSISKFIENKLNLKVNKDKSGIRTPETHRILGFTFCKKKGVKEYLIQISPQSLERFKQNIRSYVIRSYSENITDKLFKLSQYTDGWVNYFKIVELNWEFVSLDKMIRSRLRMCIWKSWKTAQNKERNLTKLGVSKENSARWSRTSKGYCRVAHSPILQTTMTKSYFKQLGYSDLLGQYQRQHV